MLGGSVALVLKKVTENGLHWFDLLFLVVICKGSVYVPSGMRASPIWASPTQYVMTPEGSDTYSPTVGIS